MFLKTYRAPDLETALESARRELGPDALVLATNQVRGRFGLTGVEVTLASTRPASETAVTVKPTRKPPREIGPRKSAGDGPAPERTDGPAFPATSPAPATAPSPRAGSSTNPMLDTAVDALVCVGVSRDLAVRFARIAAGEMSGAAGARNLARAVERGMEGILGFEPLPVEESCLFVVGPPGCGKTTTVAKLAARYSLTRPGPVFFADADVERIGSFHQTEIYSKHIGSVPARLDGPEDLERALIDAGDGGLVLVDTPGIASGDEDRSRHVRELRDIAGDPPVVLLVPSGLHREEASRLIDGFKPLRPTRAAFTRVDDGRRLGDLVTAVANANLPLSFYTNGHRIPDDLQQATPRGLAALLLRAGQQPEALQETTR